MPENAFTPVSVRRRSAAHGCAAAQHTPCKHAKRIMTMWRWHHAHSFEQLSACRAIRRHRLCARCQHVGSSSSHMAGATGRADDCKRPTGPEADAGFRRFGSSFGRQFCRISREGSRLWGDVNYAHFGPSKREIFFAGLRPAPRWGSRPRPPRIGYPDRHHHTRHRGALVATPGKSVPPRGGG